MAAVRAVMRVVDQEIIMPYLLADQPCGAAGAAEDRAARAAFDPRPFDLAMVAPRSSMPQGTNLVLLALGIPLMSMSLFFVWLGAWPVLMFSGLDLLLLAAALYAFRRREVPSERLTLENGALVHVVRDGSGREDRAELPAYWTRLAVAGDGPILHFRNVGRPVGRCLGRGERAAVTQLLQRILLPNPGIEREIR